MKYGFNLADGVFWFLAAAAAGGGLGAALSRNIVRAVFFLLLTFAAMAGLYGLLSADFLAAVQLLVYVGGVLVLMLFAVMLTSQIDTAHKSNPAGSRWLGIASGAAMLVVLWTVLARAPLLDAGAPGYAPTTAELGHALVEIGFLPLLATGFLLCAVVVGSVVIARRARDAE